MDKCEKAEMLTMSCEGVRLQSYQDSAGIWTIGVGLARTYLDGTPICEGDFCTMDQAKEWLHEYMQQNVYVPVIAFTAFCAPDNVFAALSCMYYNVGPKMFKDKSLVAAIQNQDWQSLANIMLTYSKIHRDGQMVECDGLFNRRQKEINFFLNEDGSLK